MGGTAGCRAGEVGWSSRAGGVDEQQGWMEGVERGVDSTSWSITTRTGLHTSAAYSEQEHTSGTGAMSPHPQRPRRPGPASCAATCSLAGAPGWRGPLLPLRQMQGKISQLRLCSLYCVEVLCVAGAERHGGSKCEPKLQDKKFFSSPGGPSPAVTARGSASESSLRLPPPPSLPLPNTPPNSLPDDVHLGVLRGPDREGALEEPPPPELRSPPPTPFGIRALMPPTMALSLPHEDAVPRAVPPTAAVPAPAAVPPDVCSPPIATTPAPSVLGARLLGTVVSSAPVPVPVLLALLLSFPGAKAPADAGEPVPVGTTLPLQLAL